MKTTIFESLEKKFEKTYCKKHLYFNDDCIRFDVIMAIYNDLKNKVSENEINQLINLKTDDDSLKKLNVFKEKYYNKMKEKWLIDLLINLQTKSIKNLKEFKKMGYSQNDLKEFIIKYFDCE